MLKVNPISTSCKSAAIWDSYGHSKVVLPSGIVLPGGDVSIQSIPSKCDMTIKPLESAREREENCFLGTTYP